jgi:sulfotransferase family protein
MTGPHFICIGAQRAGTTWLYTALERHPAFWLPPIKELHYFDDPLLQNRRRRLGFLRMRLIAGLWIRRPLSPWDLRYFLGRPSDAWYSRLFEPAHRRGLLSGDFTPSYATLDEKAFARMRSINPSVKIIFIMRDPIMRSWSSVLKSRQKHGAKDVLDARVAIDHSRREGVVQKSSYIETIEILDRVFAPHQVLHGFFDEITASPATFLDRVLTFLEVKSDNLTSVLPPKPVGAVAAGREPPWEFQKAVAADFLQDVRRLSERFEGAPKQWLARYESLVGAAPSPASNPSGSSRESSPACQT